MRFYFHVSDIARNTFDRDWRGHEFNSVNDAMAHAQSLRIDLSEELRFQGYVIITDDDKKKLGALEVSH
jgi:hypothetical protein